ncbi:MAG: rod shape-determining protein MreD [Bdellovibrionales bacterium]|nr:rod shape-determining protein MreD [Bdellovibrionales bacterium]
MRKSLALIVLAIFALFFQEALFPLVLPRSFVPNILLLLVLYLGFFESNEFGVIGAFLLGIFLDLSGGLVIGPWAGSFVVTFCALSLIADRVFSESPIAVSVVGLCGAALANVTFLFLTVEGLPYVRSMLSQVMSQAVVAMFLLPLLIPWLRWVMKGQRDYTDYA